MLLNSNGAGSASSARLGCHGGSMRPISRSDVNWGYLYRAVDAACQTVDFHLSRRRNVVALAKVFFQ
jgi:hypothetical protein